MSVACMVSHPGIRRSLEEICAETCIIIKPRRGLYHVYIIQELSFCLQKGTNELFLQDCEPGR